MEQKPVSIVWVGRDEGDWEGIYIDGELEIEGHSLCAMHWAVIISCFRNFQPMKRYTIENEYIDDLGSLPPKFNIIPKEVLTLE